MDKFKNSDYHATKSNKVNAFIFDQFKSAYYVTGEKVGQAWDAGKELMMKFKQFN